MLTGGCFCGKLRYEVSGTPFDATLCHCADCRRIASAPLVAWFSVEQAAFRFVKGEARSFASSANVLRTFCADCGTQLTYRHDNFPDEIDVSTCSLDAPEAVAPRHHTWVSQKLAWVHVAEDLPNHPRSGG